MTHWTKKPPAAPGYYWLRQCAGEAVMVELWGVSGKPPDTWLYVGTDETTRTEDLVRLGYEWWLDRVNPPSGRDVAMETIAACAAAVCNMCGAGYALIEPNGESLVFQHPRPAGNGVIPCRANAIHHLARSRQGPA